MSYFSYDECKNCSKFLNGVCILYDDYDFDPYDCLFYCNLEDSILSQH